MSCKVAMWSNPVQAVPKAAHTLAHPATLLFLGYPPHTAGAAPALLRHAPAEGSLRNTGTPARRLVGWAVLVVVAAAEEEEEVLAAVAAAAAAAEVVAGGVLSSTLTLQMTKPSCGGAVSRDPSTLK